MSWDVYAINVPVQFAKPEDIPETFEPTPIGTREDVITKLTQLFPEIDFSDSCWGVLNGESWSIELNLADDPVSSFMLHIRGEDCVIEVVAKILQALGLRAIDMQSGLFFEDGQGVIHSLRDWRRFRDEVIDSK